MWNKMVMWGSLRNTTMDILQVIQASHPCPKIWPQSVSPSWAVIPASGSWTLVFGIASSFLPYGGWDTFNLTTTHPAPLYVCVCLTYELVTDVGRWLSVTHRSREWQKWKACFSSKYCSKFIISIYLCLCLFTEHEISNLYVSWVWFTACSIEVLVLEELGFVGKAVLHVRRSLFPHMMLGSTASH